MDFTNLNYFRTVARCENLTQAANELYISQPGLSRYLSRLESELGVPLFDRRRGKIVLNTYGQVFLASVELAFNQLEKGAETARQLFSRDQNILSVACSIEDFLVDLLKEFSPLYPEIAIRQFSYSMSEIEEQLLRKNLDFAICAHPIGNNHIKYDLLSSCPFVLICHEDNPLAKEDSIWLQQAAQEKFLCESSRLNERELAEFCGRAGFTPQISHEVVNGYILINLLESGTDVALLPLAYLPKIHRQLPNHHLRFLRLRDEDLPQSELGMVYLDDHVQSTAAKCFLDFIHQSLSSDLQNLEDVQIYY